MGSVQRGRESFKIEVEFEQKQNRGAACVDCYDTSGLRWPINKYIMELLVADYAHFRKRREPSVPSMPSDRSRRESSLSFSSRWHLGMVVLRSCLVFRKRELPPLLSKFRAQSYTDGVHRRRS